MTREYIDVGRHVRHHFNSTCPGTLGYAILTGPTAHRRRPPTGHTPDRLPITLQDHASPVRFRNTWVRDLER